MFFLIKINPYSKLTYVLTCFFIGFLLLIINVKSTHAAISLDRTRIIFLSTDKSISLNIANDNKKLPYLAQGWIENDKGEKVSDPFIVLPPIQRIEPDTKSQIKIQALKSVNSLSQVKESVYYFNLREIPPKSDKQNTLQLALQTRIKLFYRPKSIILTNEQMEYLWKEKLTLTLSDGYYIITNPTPYYLTIIDATSSEGGNTVMNFEPIMIEPHGSKRLNGDVKMLGNKPVLTYINDYGGRKLLNFKCHNNKCFPEK
jgi:P pilus assembly chaperone PapD